MSSVSGQAAVGGHRSKKKAVVVVKNKTRDRKSSRASKKGSKGKQSDTIPMEDRHGGSSDSEQEEVVAEPTSIGTLKKEKEVRAGAHDDGSSSESEVEERRERRDPPVEERPPATTPRTSSFESSTPRDRSASDVHSGSVVSKSEFSLDDSWWIDYDELELEDKVSESATATVYHGEYRGQEVAVKIFNPEMINREKLVKEFQMISSIRSPHVVVFYGLCLEPHIAVVMEKCGYGSLDEVLANHTDRQFDWNRFFSLAEGLIGGLNTFHNNKPQILHREIRPQNLLINSDWKLKYADFGRARYNERGDEGSRRRRLILASRTWPTLRRRSTWRVPTLRSPTSTLSAL